VIPELSDAQIEVQALVREFCRREVAPHTAAWDSEHHVPMAPWYPGSVTQG
jgi:alkylation response protein AidB-like acyl-CoA dehydrogenase